ncbi:hypothetical protein CALCODRAFT_507435 [Calocera cornea HHB12733]|uniref:Uncharacterized protein n=1 Tax=Calocera cornea HHB12733 TaxID=1353952 RepID=A0A165HPA1_9BASI|nr:hypothetical protein CALCODRAFT_507435 [Calocera cornea HHB12733]
MEFRGNHGPLITPSQKIRVGPFGERLTLDGRAVQDGRYNIAYPGQRLSPEVTPLPIHSSPPSAHILYKLDDDAVDVDDATQRGFWSRLRTRRRSSVAAREGLGRIDSRQTTSSEGALSFESDEVWRGEDDGPGPYELYGQLDHAELVRIYTAMGVYQSRWASLPSLPRRPEWTFESIPWPSTAQPNSLSDLDRSAIRTFLLAALGYGQDRRQRLGLELQRWQPEEFAAKWLPNVKSSERAKVVEGVAMVRRVLMEMSSDQ